MLDWWIGLNRWWKLSVSIIFLAIAAGELILAHVFRPWTWGIGLVLLFFTLVLGPSKGEKDGWEF